MKLVAFSTGIWLAQASVSPTASVGTVDAVREVYRNSFGVGVALSPFLHGSLTHLFSNVVFLLLLGLNVEERLGKAKAAALIVAGAYVSHAGSAWIHQMAFGVDQVVLYGASGVVFTLAGVELVRLARGQDLIESRRVVSASAAVTCVAVVGIDFFTGQVMTPGWINEAHLVGLLFGLGLGGVSRLLDE